MLGVRSDPRLESEVSRRALSPRRWRVGDAETESGWKLTEGASSQKLCLCLQRSTSQAGVLRCSLFYGERGGGQGGRAVLLRWSTEDPGPGELGLQTSPHKRCQAGSPGGWPELQGCALP